MRCTVNGKFKTCSKQGGTTYTCVQSGGSGNDEDVEKQREQQKLGKWNVEKRGEQKQQQEKQQAMATIVKREDMTLHKDDQKNQIQEPRFFAFQKYNVGKGPLVGSI